MKEEWEESHDEWTEDDEEEKQQGKQARRLGLLHSARLLELEANLHNICGIKKSESCEFKGALEFLERETAATFRCGHIFCQQCISNDRVTPRNARFCPKCSKKFRSMYVLNEQGKLVPWSIGGDREKNPGRKRRREEEGGSSKQEKGGKDCVVQ